ncbi:Riboflavin biosynthesis protein ribF [Corynebacterium kutscheri]|uniref:Riboflavin biosynthesis protein n=1 Tax=Corynebacterium kutscheri TaxID=35755 RepID=A0A0F6TE17_9CORY|nr:bifunctional riboflavin kinase/FAD synthetase [Corynebacterium kutscheri]AKE41436.1 riboflavin kinase/FMN adenylyltransferase [Corynebacterium kutscheri]VEH08713.1 Riboflavin biosynthesis protein ribF [Corynebacterium kutscheri]VEH09760.1 Riboflavin biosynthesis protein ribF [Corynebacterium kutscheri]VEH79843.1 Riboflavin biosynthesis protein ribF [Corynebacterium kutscheri]
MDVDIWHGLDDVPQDFAASVVTIGVFDGIHRGHRLLISEATQRARSLGVPSLLLTFNPHPLAILRPDHMPPMLGSVAQRADLAEELGVDHMLALNFTADLSRKTPEEFFHDIVVGTLKAKAVVVGENFTFGFKAAGTTATLRKLCADNSVELTVVPLLTEDDTVVCSTFIRNALTQGNIRQANWALGREFSVKGEVVRGAGRGGKELGFPTANLYFPDSVALPRDAVYAAWFTVVSEAPIDGDIQRGVRYPAAVSVGHNPTFGDERRSVESYVIDRDADLYGHTVVVEFVDHVRDMEKFSGVEELLDAMARDVENTRQILGVQR